MFKLGLTDIRTRLSSNCDLYAIPRRFQSSNKGDGLAKSNSTRSTAKKPIRNDPEQGCQLDSSTNKRTLDTAMRSINPVHIPEDRAKTRYLVPRIPSTDYIPTSEVQTEGFFAGYRPLFLGNSSFRREARSSSLDNFFTSFASLKVTDESKGTMELDVQDVIEDLKRDNNLENMQNSKGKNRRLIIPWDASISGMVYNDHSFKDVPRNIVSKLKPFKMVRLEKASESNSKVNKGTDMIKMKFHNSKVSDEFEMVNLLNVHNSRNVSRSRNNEHVKDQRDIAREARKAYEKEMKSFAVKHKFIKSDQKIFKNEADKLNRMLAREFNKQTNLSIRTEFAESILPLYIYVDKSISSRRLFRSFLKKKLIEHVEPVLSSILSSYDSQEQADRFHAKVRLKIANMVRELPNFLPSVYFTGHSVDCVIHSSPVVGFKRIHWLKPSKRRTVFWGKNIDLDYLFNLDGNFNVTRSGVKYMKYPVNLQWRTFDAAFSEWDYFA